MIHARTPSTDRLLFLENFSISFFIIYAFIISLTHSSHLKCFIRRIYKKILFCTKKKEENKKGKITQQMVSFSFIPPTFPFILFKWYNTIRIMSVCNFSFRFFLKAFSFYFFPFFFC